MQAGPIGFDEARDKRWDVVVVGTGIGGATLGHALARKGHSVLFIEKGVYLFGGHDRGDGTMMGEEANPALRMRKGWWPQQIHGRTSYAERLAMYFPLGCGTGGGSALYAAQLERMQPSDFEPRRYHAAALDSSLPDAWPIPYEDMLPFYREAERLYHVVGTPDPLNPDPEADLGRPPSMSERDAYLFDEFRDLGLNPYRAHVGCKYLPGCSGCGGALCPRKCKTDAGLVCLLPAVESYGAAVLAEAEVVRLEADRERVTGVTVEKDGQRAEVKGEIVVLAAGALMTPCILLRSTNDSWPTGLANRSDLVGRNLMMHTSDFIAVRPSKMLDAAGPAKAISLNDLYIRKGRKLGAFQSVGLPVNEGSIDAFLRGQTEKDPKWYLKASGRIGRKVASKVGAALFGQANVFASVVEDLPYHHNRVFLDANAPNGMRFDYTYPDELRERNELFRSELDRAMSSKLRTLVLGGEKNLNYGHVSGTVRSGLDPDRSVIDAENRAHHVENLYVADASAFPSSGGINPSLTIAANSLRVAEAIHARFAAAPDASLCEAASG